MAHLCGTKTGVSMAFIFSFRSWCRHFYKSIVGEREKKPWWTLNKLLLPIFVDTAAGLCKTLISFLCDAVVFSLHRSGNWQLLFVIAFNEKRMTFVFFFPFFARQLSTRDRHIPYQIQVVVFLPEIAPQKSECFEEFYVHNSSKKKKWRGFSSWDFVLVEYLHTWFNSAKYVTPECRRYDR